MFHRAWLYVSRNWKRSLILILILTVLLSALAEEEIPLSISRAEGGRLELEETPLYSASVGMAMPVRSITR